MKKNIFVVICFLFCVVSNVFANDNEKNVDNAVLAMKMYYQEISNTCFDAGVSNDDFATLITGIHDMTKELVVGAKMDVDIGTTVIDTANGLCAVAYKCGLEKDYKCRYNIMLELDKAAYKYTNN